MNKSQLADSASTAEAIDRVLSAEADAREAMRECHEQADRLLETAREDARRILRTANKRASGLDEICNRLIKEKTGMLREKASQVKRTDELDDDDHARLADAVERVAEKLTRIEE